MPLDQEAIDQQLALLATHRRTLAHLLEQAAQYGGEVFAPPQTANGITEARQQIRRIKATLREGDFEVEDEPNDEASPVPELPQRVGGDVVAGDKVGGDKMMGDKRTVDTGGGDYAEGNIDKRQGNFISGGTVQGPVIADNQGIVNVNYNYQQTAFASALHQLRAPIGDFVGREQEIDQLVQTLSKAANSGAAGAISGVRGMGGIGKSELAYAAAQQLLAQFPDAQLLVELRGARANPLTPEAALQTVIRSFEREAKLPDDLGQLQALYRSVLTDKKTLILADDAKDAAQVRPLLPPAGCALLVTSRNRFSLPGMEAIDLGTLQDEEAEKLLLGICPRIDEQAPELAKLCGYLPLALRISAGVLEANDIRAVAHYLKRLAAERLKHLSDPDDPQASVEASLRLSYDALAPAAQTTLCQLSVFPTSFDHAAAVAVVEVEDDAEEALELLRRRSLLEWDAQLQRYGLHDLVRVFAAARLTDADTVRLRHARHYTKVASHAQFGLYLKGNALSGLALVDLERTHIDAGWNWAMAHAGDPVIDALILNYSDALNNLANLRYDARRERIPQLEAQRGAAQRLGRRAQEGYALNHLGHVYNNLGETRQAIAFSEQALEIHREIGDRRSEGLALMHLGNAHSILGEMRQAIAFYEQALEIHREIGDRRSEGLVLMNLGNAHSILGETGQAIDFCEQALAIHRQDGDRRIEGLVLNTLGNVYRSLGDAHQAIAFYEQALAIHRGIGNRRGEAATNWNLSRALEKEGNLARAAELMEVLVDYYREIGHPDAEQRGADLKHLRQRLAASQDTTPAENTDEA